MTFDKQLCSVVLVPTQTTDFGFGDPRWFALCIINVH